MSYNRVPLNNEKDQTIDTYNMMNLDMTFKYLLQSKLFYDSNNNSTHTKKKQKTMFK